MLVISEKQPVFYSEGHNLLLLYYIIKLMNYLFIIVILYY